MFSFVVFALYPVPCTLRPSLLTPETSISPDTRHLILSLDSCLLA